MSDRPMTLSRRSFLKLSAMFGGAVAVGWRPWTEVPLEAAPPTEPYYWVEPDMVQEIVAATSDKLLWIDGQPVQNVHSLWVKQQLDPWSWPESPWPGGAKAGYAVVGHELQLTAKVYPWTGPLGDEPWQSGLYDLVWSRADKPHAFRSKLYFSRVSWDFIDPEHIAAELDFFGREPVQIVPLEDFLASL